MSDSLDLDALLIESVEIRDAKQNLKTARKAAAVTTASTEERHAIEEKIREWEAKTEWRAVAVVAMFTEQHCSCCFRIHTVFAGIFQRQEHRVNKASRWVREKTPAHLNLPKEQKANSEHAPFCHVCAEGQGFAAPQPFQSQFPVTRTF